jgi:bacteriorhodopsin
MLSAEFVKYTTKLSLIAQVLTGLLGFAGIFLSLPTPHAILGGVLKLEMIVQLIEFAFYIWLYTFFNLPTMAPIRYIDWFITTPMMLLSMAVYFTYVRLRKEERVTTLSEFFNTYRPVLIQIFSANFLMLLFGLLGELAILPFLFAFILGSLAFVGSFTIIYRHFYSKESKVLFTLLTVVWALYGVSYLFPIAAKNIGFNLLDVIAKNFFGVFLFYMIYKNRTPDVYQIPFTLPKPSSSDTASS